MPVTFLPSQILKKLAPAAKIKKLISNRLTLNRAVLGQLSDNPIMSKKAVEKVALKVLKDYKSRYADEIEAGASQAEALGDTLGGRELLINRVQNSIVYETGQEVKRLYEGNKYEWLPSDAEIPDPLHQLNYGKIFTVGEGDANGEDPGDRYGCKCGMRILTEDDELYLDDELGI